jgi:hypothetical protein
MRTLKKQRKAKVNIPLKNNSQRLISTKKPEQITFAFVVEV